MPVSNPIYLDNAATSFPKPPEVAETMDRLLRSMALSPGRAAHAYSLEAGRLIFEARESIADFFGCPDSSRVVFTGNATESLNVGIMGLLGPGEHVVVTPMEHNSVMRPLRFLEKEAGIEISILPASAQGVIDPAALAGLLRKNTRLIVMSHVSNVTGSVAPIHEAAKVKGDAVFMVDAAQSAGVLPIDVEALGIDFLAFTGHKALLGPTGTGGFIVRPGLGLRPLKMGGTGSASEKEEQPSFAPDRYEAGTPNTLGIAGLAAGVDFIKRTGLQAIRRHEQRLARAFLEGLLRMPGATVHGPGPDEERSAVVSFRLAGKSVSEVAFRLDRDFRIMTRAGLHCAPLAHRAIGTFPEGTVRVSFGFFNTAGDVEACLNALEQIRRS